MATDLNKMAIPDEVIIRKIYWIRHEKVMLDSDLALLFGVPTKVLKQSVKRNMDRFPEDFMFTLSKAEFDSLRSQFVTLKRGEHSKYLPYAFTEQGVAMLSGALNSKQAISVNIAIMRAIVQLRRFLESNKELAIKMEELEKAVAGHDEKINLIFQAIKQLIKKKEEPQPERRPIGYKV
ncbi:MAG: ORF6N domain-containing protein [Bacteroidota bacterium]